LAFAKIRATHPGLSVRESAERAGYAKAGAAVRGFELLRDDRVVRAILHFSALALAKSAAELSQRMETSCKDEPYRWPSFDRRAIDKLRAETKRLGDRLTKIETLYEATS
jgi:hypothetical protein